MAAVVAKVVADILYAIGERRIFARASLSAYARNRFAARRTGVTSLLNWDVLRLR